MSSSSKRPEVFRFANFNVPAGGSLNWAISILEWVLRSPRDDGAVQCHETNSTLLASEAATLKYIRINSTIPVPQVFAYRFVLFSSRPFYPDLLTIISASRDNEIGVPYILMSKASGFPLSFRWEVMTYKEKAKILYQLGTITWQLSRLRLSHIGSLYEDETGLHVKSFLSCGLLTHERHSLKHLNRGPFPVVADYFNSLLSAFSEHAKYLPLRPHCLFVPVPLQSEYIDFPKYKGATDGMTSSSWVLRLTARQTDWITPLLGIYFQKSFRSGLPQSRDELDQPLVAAFEKGLKGVAYDALRLEELHEYHHLCQILQCSRLRWLLSRLLSFDSIADFKLFREIWRVMGLHRNQRQGFRLRQSFFNYRQLYEEIRQEDRTAEQISCDEKNYFKNRN
ncbi:hypothetical protein EMCG_05722 [[Emmonsia] crescens]|uniref:Aminoglycoside phosphotransferase domain-containing protein n=1 Tax=[Emmonsia] crescens TaxID=73230 RepID=A0A0G2IDD5_9EURO|nr:hypothetical protein EMCG_05722 [Emmonsia crescens UAMH 3008]